MDNRRNYNDGSRHTEFSGSAFYGGQTFYLKEVAVRISRIDTLPSDLVPIAPLSMLEFGNTSLFACLTLELTSSNRS
ncbi:hypothetical protein BDD12DRAFT_894811 [Trichophaea hybrida]|nr:hypothetical protein BDD12DRAFT_894811 [Trichophaea hybrida]